MSKSVAFEELRDLIVSLGNQTIERSPTKVYEVEKKMHWAVHSARLAAGNLTFPYQILYIASECSLDSLDRARLHCRDHATSEFQVVYANSLEKKVSFAKPLNSISASGPLSVKNFLVSAFKDQIEAYKKELKKIDAEHFVQPTWTVTDHGSKASPIDYLRQVGNGSNSVGNLGVVTGEAGQGKTYLAWRLLHLALAADIVPIFVTSENWKNMSQADQENLSAVIASTFRSFGVAFDIPPDKADRFIEIFLKAGLFAVVFDGFDEYVFRNHAGASGFDAVRDIIELCRTTDAPVLITSRTTAWTDLVQAYDIPEHKDCIRWSLSPFEADQARKYFDSRMQPSNEKLAKRATDLFISAKQQTASHGAPDLIGRGFFLPLLFDLVSKSDGAPTDTSDFGGMSPTHWIVNALCNREVERYNVGAGSWQTQLLKKIAVRQSSNVIVSSQQLAVWLQELGRTESDTAKLIGDPDTQVGNGTLCQHPLLKNSGGLGWNIPYATIVNYLVAEYVYDLLNSGDRAAIDLFLRETQLTRNALVAKDVLACVIDLIREVHGAKSIEVVSAKISSVMTTSVGALSRVSTQIRSLCTNLCVAAVDAFYRREDASARAGALRKFFPASDFGEAVFSGHLVDYDWSETVFVGATFDNVVWSSCKFSSRTKFSNCEFVGGQVVSSGGFGNSTFASNCRFDDLAASCVAREAVRAQKRNYSQDDLIHDLKHVLRKLLPTESQSPRIKGNALLQGTIGLYVMKYAALEIINTFIADELSAEGKPGTYRLRPTVRGAVTYARTNGAFTGVVRQTYEELAKVSLN